MAESGGSVEQAPVARMAGAGKYLTFQLKEEIYGLEILKVQDEEVAGGLNPIKSNADFHRLLARMAKNRVLERLLLALFDLLGKTRERYLQTEERKQKSLQGHHEILNVIRSGNGPAARQVMRRHLEGVEDTLFKKRKEVEKNGHFQRKRSLQSRDSA